MAIVEWKNRSGIGGHFDGDFTLPSESDRKVYDDFINALRNGQVKTSYHFNMLY